MHRVQVCHIRQAVPTVYEVRICLSNGEIPHEDNVYVHYSPDVERATCLLFEAVLLVKLLSAKVTGVCC